MIANYFELNEEMASRLAEYIEASGLSQDDVIKLALTKLWSGGNE